MAAPTSASAADDPWSKLPGDLLGEVYSRISSPRSRIRFAAACRSWRAFASSQPRQPAVPWLLLSAEERVFCPVDGATYRAPFLSETTGKSPVGFHDGGWVAATSSDGGHRSSLVIVNLLSGAEVPLSPKQRTIRRRTIRKVAFSEAPTSKHCILAATTMKSGLALCRVGSPNHSWWTWEGCHNYEDIIFCHGKLYGLYRSTLFMHDLRMTKAGSTVVSATREVRTGQAPRVPEFSENYIVEYKDTLLRVLRLRVLGSSSRQDIFKVFELVGIENACCCHHHVWAKVTTLDDHALFLSTKCSKAVRVPASGRSGVERNHIYYDYIGNLPREHVSILDNNLHCMENRKGNGADKITSTGYYVTSPRQHLTWLLPPDF